MVYPQKGILSSNEKEQATYPLNTMLTLKSIMPRHGMWLCDRALPSVWEALALIPSIAPTHKKLDTESIYLVSL